MCPGNTCEPVRVELEREARLSESVLWRHARSFYEREGVAAWGSGFVPHWVTSNPQIAHAYARVVLAFLRDCAAAGEIDGATPVRLVELGAGPGRFAHAFLRALLPALDAALPGTRFTYVMTDLAERNVEAWRSHAALRPLVERGSLDFARFDVQACDELRLVESGETLGAGASLTPTIVVANYLLDSLPPDCFTVIGGGLRETRLTATVPEAADRDDPRFLEELEVTWTLHPFDGGYYGEADLDAVLAAYADRLGDTTFLFPVTALRCVRFFRELAGGRLLLLSADQGNASAQELIGRGGPGFALHGAVSCLVNYHAIAEYVRSAGGLALHPRHRAAHLTVAAYVLGAPAAGSAETAAAYDAAVAEGGPDDWYTVKHLLDAVAAELTLEQALAFLRVSGWDTKVFLDLFPRLVTLLEDAPVELHPDVYRMARAVSDAYYDIGDGYDVAFCLGILLSGIGYRREALELFERSLELVGPDPTTAYAIATMRYELRELEAARDWTERVLALDPAFAPAKDLRVAIDAHLELAGA